jgi:RES domain
LSGHPGPPADLARRRPRLRTLPAGTRLHRFHTKERDGRRLAPAYFDRGLGGRLNAPDGSYGVLYVALSAAGAFAETFLRTPGRTLLDPELVAAKAYAELALTRDLAALELHGPGAAAIGATAELTHGPPPYGLPQSWSHALHGHPCAADALAYRARHNDDEVCLAVFERAAAALSVVGGATDLDADWFYELAEEHGVGLPP